MTQSPSQTPWLRSLLFFGLWAGVLSAQSLTPFEDHGDIGVTPQKGKVEAEGSTFRLTGGGDNIWGPADAFHFLWKQVNF